MQKALIGIAIVVVVVLTAKFGLGRMFAEGELHSAQERVRGTLDGLKGGGDRQKAIALWQRGSLTVPGGMEGFGQAADGFERWCREGKIAANISSYEVGDAVISKPSTPMAGAVVTVSGSIDGQPFKMQVQKDEPIAWLN